VTRDATSEKTPKRTMSMRKLIHDGSSNGRLFTSVRQIRGNARPISSKTPLNDAMARNNATQPVRIAVSFAIISVDVRHGSIRRRPTVRSSTSPANAIAVAATIKKMQNIDDVSSEFSQGLA
jgi:hypothetical protein